MQLLQSQSTVLEKSLSSSQECQYNSLQEQNSTPNTLVFIDAAVDEAQSLANGVIPGAKVILLDPERDGVEQITEILKRRTNVSSVHIISHGSPGCLSIGTTQLCLDNLDRYVSDWQIWLAAFSPKSGIHEASDLLLYGCNIADGEVGVAFLKRLHQLTGANIAASTQRTGNSTLGGNWELGYRVGTIETPLAFEPWVMEAYPSVLPTTLYNGTLGTLPQNQGFLTFGDLFPNTAAQTLVTGGVTLDTTPQAPPQNPFGRRYAGYSNYTLNATLANPNFPTLDSTTGFSIAFNVAVSQENSLSPNRAGFSLIAITNDLQGIEIGFNNNLIFAQQDNPLFTRGENVAFNTAQATNYSFRVLNNNYTLFANGTQILTGTLRDYSAFNPATSDPPVPFNPYTPPSQTLPTVLA